MDCTACSITIDGELEDAEGVKKARTSYAQSQTEIEYEENKITPKQIATIIKQSGYTAVLAGE